MGFSSSQQGIFRPMVKRAWQRHCRGNAVPLQDKEAYKAWYQEELLNCIGQETTSACNKTRDFETVMAHFEAIVGDDIHWQFAVFRGDSKRIIHNLNQLATGHDLDEEYLRKIARNALQRDHLPDLHTLPPEDLLTILRSVKIYIRRRLLQDDPSLTPGPEAPEDIRWSYAAQAAASNPAPVEISEEADQPF